MTTALQVRTPVVDVLTLLNGIAAVTDLVDDYGSGKLIAGGEFEPDKVKALSPMKTGAILVQRNGGTRAPETARIFKAYIDVRCYAPTRYAADYLSALVYLHLQGNSRLEGGVLNLTQTGSEISGRDTDTDWPVTFQTFEALVSEV